MNVLACDLKADMVVILNGKTVRINNDIETTAVGTKWRVKPFGEAFKTVFIRNEAILRVPHSARTTH